MVDIATFQYADAKEKKSLVSKYRDYGAKAVGRFEETFAVASQPRRALHEFNPMLGLRGCRLGITYPEITEMQVRAIFEAPLRFQGRRQRSIPR